MFTAILGTVLQSISHTHTQLNISHDRYSNGTRHEILVLLTTLLDD